MRPGRDRRAVLHRAETGEQRADGQHVVVLGGGIAGMSAACILAERGVAVTLIEREETWGGRARSWQLPDGRSMSRGFHAFFRQYYTLRAILERADRDLNSLVSVGDYPLILADGPRDSFRNLPRTPPWSIAAFALRSRSFPFRQLLRINVPAALQLLKTDFPGTFVRFDGRSAQEFLDELRFPPAARHLALEVFARSFFADPAEFSAGELVGMFHTYFMGSAEGLIFDVPVDAYSTALWDPLIRFLVDHNVRALPATVAHSIEAGPDGVRVETTAGPLTADGVVVAADPRTSRSLLTPVVSGALGWGEWVERIRKQRNAPPFAVWRLWLDRSVRPDTPAFLATSGYGPLDNLSVLNTFESTARRWSQESGGSVVELHAYALDGSAVGDASGLRERLWSALVRLHPELAGSATVHQEWLVEDDCPLVDTQPWTQRPEVATPDSRIVLAGDWLRTDEPVALMERAALTGVQAANQLLAHWGVAGQDWWSVSMRGILRRRPA